MKERDAKLKIIGLIIELENRLDNGKRDEYWWGNKFDSLIEESISSLHLKYRLLEKKEKENR
jgi:hypothetical protein